MFLTALFAQFADTRQNAAVISGAGAEEDLADSFGSEQRTNDGPGRFLWGFEVRAVGNGADSVEALVFF